MTKIRKFAAKALKYLFFPPAGRCPYCRDEMGDGSICKKCRKELRSYEIPFDTEAAFRARYFYFGIVRSIVMQFKFSGRTSLANNIARDMLSLIRKDTDIITFVPLHEKRQKARGYNQAELIACELSKMTGIPVKPLIIRNRDTLAQSLIDDYEERVKNVLDAFSPIEGADIKGRKVVLVDDVVTTGATSNECIKILFSLNADRVEVVSFAAARGM